VSMSLLGRYRLFPPTVQRELFSPKATVVVVRLSTSFILRQHAGSRKTERYFNAARHAQQVTEPARLEKREDARTAAHAQVAVAARYASNQVHANGR